MTLVIYTDILKVFLCALGLLVPGVLLLSEKVFLVRGLRVKGGYLLYSPRRVLTPDNPQSDVSIRLTRNIRLCADIPLELFSSDYVSLVHSGIGGQKSC